MTEDSGVPRAPRSGQLGAPATQPSSAEFAPADAVQDLVDWAERCAMNLQRAASSNPEALGAHPCECMAFAADLRERVEALLRGKWRPIETAPKDGTRVDLLYPYPRGRTIDCFWDTSSLGPAWIRKEPRWENGVLLPEDQWSTAWYPNMEPTHWMPAPELPPAHRASPSDSGA